jgi:transcription antitermination factor NusG
MTGSPNILAVEGWYALRVTYGRAFKFKTVLDEAGFRTFVPMCRKTVERNGKRTKITVPAVTNLCFVRSTQDTIYTFLKNQGESCPASFMWDKATRNPVIVPDKPMEDFMRICLVMNDEALYLKDITSKLHEGQRVRVTDGPFKGIEGVVLRVKRSRRVIVDFPGLLAIATNYIDPRFLEAI